MVTSNPGRLAKLEVGSAVEVGGVRSLKPSKNWNTEKPMHLGDDAPSTLLNYKEWTISVEMTADYTDSGQNAIRAAFEAGTSLAIKPYKTASLYWTGTALVTKQDAPIDGTKRNVETYTLEPYDGSDLTPSA